MCQNGYKLRPTSPPSHLLAECGEKKSGEGRREKSRGREGRERKGERKGDGKERRKGRKMRGVQPE